MLNAPAFRLADGMYDVDQDVDELRSSKIMYSVYFFFFLVPAGSDVNY